MTTTYYLVQSNDLPGLLVAIAALLIGALAHRR